MTEISYLILSIGLLLGMIVVQSLASLRHYGLVPLAGARDDLKSPTFFMERAKRANQNMLESLALFVPLILIALHTDQLGTLTLTGSALFFWGRLAYAPLYWFGVPWARTLAWAVALVGILMIFSNLLPLI